MRSKCGRFDIFVEDEVLYKILMAYLFYVESLSQKSQQTQKRATCLSLHVPIILTVRGPLVISELSSKLPSSRKDHISPIMAILSRSFSGFPPGGDM